MAFWETTAQIVATVGGLGGFAAFYQANLSHRSEKVKARTQAAASHEEITLRQQQELNADEQKFRADVTAALESQRAVNAQISKDYSQLERDYSTLLGRVERQAERIQEITALQMQLEYWQNQAKLKATELKAAYIHLESAKAEAEQWRNQVEIMQAQIVQLSAEIDQLRSQMITQEQEIEELRQFKNTGGSP